MTTEQSSDPGQPSLDQMTMSQLEHYATELRDLYREEAKLRRELETDKQQLEQRIRELTALNQLFQQHLAERYEALTTLREVSEGLRGIADAADQFHGQMANRVGGLAESLGSFLERVDIDAPSPDS